MKIIISPTKTMVEDYTLDFKVSTPILLDKTEFLLNYLKSFSQDSLKELLNCNDKLTTLNYNRFQKMNLKGAVTPALFAYTGLQYKNMNVNVFTDLEYDYLNEHLRIISGFYGILKPFDGITSYRLEMQSELKGDSFNNLYEFWSSQLFDALNDKLIINLASDEYAKAIKPYLKEDTKLITISFYEKEADKLKTKATLAKMARGKMVRFMAERQIKDINQIKEFNELGFAYDDILSTESNFVFVK